MTTLKKGAKEQVSVADSLEQRGILDSATRQHCRIVGNTLEIPLYDFDGQPFATRVKDFTPGTQYKYFWKPSRPDHPLADWYITQDAIQAIKDNNGVCYLANGEPSNLSLLMTPQLYNTICTTQSEMSIPSNLITILERLGVRELRYLADNDRAGWQSAIKWRDALLSTDIVFKAYQWGKELKSHTDKQGEYMACVDKPPKYDANDLWIECGFDTERMIEAMNNLVQMHLPQPEVNYQNSFDSSEFEETPDGLIRALVAYYGKKHFSSPFREDRHPSFSIHPETGWGRDWSTGDRYSPIAMAKNANIDWQTYYPKPEHKSEPTEADIAFNQKMIEQHKQQKEYNELLQNHIIDFVAARKAQLAELLGYDPDLILYDRPALPGGVERWVESDHLPIALISAVLNLSKGVLPLVFVKMHQALTLGTLRPHFTIKELGHVTGVSRVTLPKVINLLSDWGFVKKLGVYIYNTIDSISKDMVEETLQNSGGRPAEYYAIDDKWQNKLYDALQIYFIEKYFNRTITTDLSQLIADLGLSENEAEQFRDRARLARGRDGLEARKAYRQEMFGDNHNWGGWAKALQSAAYLDIDWRDVLDMKQMRAFILREWVLKYRAINTIDEQKRLLGCSETTISDIRPLGRVKSIPQPSTVTFDAPRSVRDLAAKFRATATELRAAIWQVKFKDEEGWGGNYSPDEYLEQFSKNIHRCKEILFIMNTPSKQVIVSGDEVAHVWLLWRMKILELAALYNALIALGEIDLYFEMLMKLWFIAAFNIGLQSLVISNSHKSTVTFESNENWLTHSSKWLFKQLRLHIHAYTPDLQLWPSLHLVRPMTDDLDGCPELIAQFETLNEVNDYLNIHGSLRPCRDVASFYGKSYDEELDMKVLEAEAIKRLAWLDDNENVEDSPVLPVKAIETLKQIELPNPIAVVDKPISETERKRRETLELLKAKSRAEYLKMKVGA